MSSVLFVIWYGSSSIMLKNPAVNLRPSESMWNVRLHLTWLFGSLISNYENLISRKMENLEMHTPNTLYFCTFVHLHTFRKICSSLYLLLKSMNWMSIRAAKTFIQFSLSELISFEFSEMKLRFAFNVVLYFLLSEDIVRRSLKCVKMSTTFQQLFSINNWKWEIVK